VGGYVRRLFRHFHPNATPSNVHGAPSSQPGSVESDPRAALSPGLVRQVREIAFSRAQAVGFDAERAGLLADAVAGGISVGG